MTVRRWPDRVVRVGLFAFAALHLWWGAWARFDPRGFFSDFPGLGHRWTAGYPPYNEHLVTDLGDTFLTFALLLGLAGWLADRRVSRVVLAGVALFGLLHLAFHAAHAGRLGGADYGWSTATLVGGVVVPVGLLLLTWWPTASRRTRGDG